ncbi:MAG: hypothetical protein JST00_07605 [Deltaproteobacteria bacterium]|nr:hypothetical protein [Deltaproteobacteria bacterium]
MKLTTTLVSVAAALLLVCAGCDDKKKSTRWDDAGAAAASAAETAASASAGPVSAAGALNKYFPADGANGYKRVFAADKAGYAEAKLQKDGKDVATISINDGVKPFAKAKFDETTDKLEGFPLLKMGENQSAVLVKDRYQVKVTSTTLDHEARKGILSSFDLKGMN